MQDMGEVVHDSPPDQADCLEHLGRRDLVERSGFVVRTPPGDGRRVKRCRHSDDQVVSNDGNRVRPPSTNSVCPVMYDASVDRRNAVAAAISDASPARRIGMCDSTAWRLTGSSIQDRLIGVTVAPGPTPLTLMPRLAYSRASVWVRFCIPPLLTL